MLLAPIPWADRVWALPFMSVLCPSKRYYTQRHRTPLTLLQRGQGMLRLVARWLPTRRVVLAVFVSRQNLFCCVCVSFFCLA